eukprot:1774398-Pyramimonas_sp.AAC.1
MPMPLSKQHSERAWRSSARERRTVGSGSAKRAKRNGHWKHRQRTRRQIHRDRSNMTPCAIFRNRPKVSASCQ